MEQLQKEKVKISLAVIISDLIKACFVVESGLNLKDYHVYGFENNVITLINDKGIKVEIEAQFQVKVNGAN